MSNCTVGKPCRSGLVVAAVRAASSLVTVLWLLMIYTPLLWPQAIITTVAGRGRVLTGIGGPATNVPLATIWGLAVDVGGNVYIADESHNMVFKVLDRSNAAPATGR